MLSAQSQDLIQLSQLHHNTSDPPMLLYLAVIVQCQSSSLYGGSAVFYTSGERRILENCNSTFIWRPNQTSTIPVTYTAWGIGQPDCYGGTESCIQIWTSPFVYGWNDVDCWKTGCPICQFDMP